MAGPESPEPQLHGPLPSRVLYSICARIGGTGLDVDAFEALRGIFRANILGKAIAYGNRQNEIPAALIRDLRNHPVRVLGFLAGGNVGKAQHYYGAKRKYVDWIAARGLRTGKYDLFHGWGGESLRSLRVAHECGIPSVLEIPTWHRNKGKQKPPLTKSERERDALPLHKRMVESLLVTRQQALEEYDLADLILVLSHKAAETFTSAGIAEDKLFYLPRGVDIDRFRPAPPPPIFRALFVGALIKRKGVHFLLEAWHRLGLKNAELILLGSAHKEILPYLEKFGASNVRVAGFSARTEEFFQQASAHVFPSTCEGSAKVTYEAAACGLPQITTREAGDVVIDGLNGLVVPCGDIDALATAIEKLHANPQLRAQMGRAARERAEQNFTWDHYRSRLLEAYSRATHLRQKR